MRHSRARCSGSVASRRIRSSADCITTTCESEFLVHTTVANTGFGRSSKVYKSAVADSCSDESSRGGEREACFRCEKSRFDSPLRNSLLSEKNSLIWVWKFPVLLRREFGSKPLNLQCRGDQCPNLARRAQLHRWTLMKPERAWCRCVWAQPASLPGFGRSRCAGFVSRCARGSFRDQGASAKGSPLRFR